jgi:sterol desaturase/sphingolipid hydroxylase (fatty acid hydroxylase superfamily)
MSRRSKIEELLNSRTLALARRFGATYTVKDFAIGARGGSYNLVGVLAVVLVVCACLGRSSALLAAIAAISIVASLLLDRESMSRKLDLAALPAQVVSYLHLVLLWLRDIGPGLVLCFLCYSLIEPYFKELCLWGGNSFWIVYGAYGIVRTSFLVKYLLTIWMRWDDGRPPFEIRRANMRTRGEAARHLLWSFFLGNAGLIVRCGQQIAMIVVFDELQILLGMGDLRPGPLAAVVGLLGGLFVYFVLAFCSAAPLYYKIHRTLHENRTLFTAVHRIHHKAVYPTVLDSGTESPLEFALTEMLGCGHCNLPDWLYVALQMAHMFIHHTAHHSSISQEGRLHFHVDHHRLFLHNYGLVADPPIGVDGAFGTLFAGRHDEKPVGTSTAAPAPALEDY